MDGLVAIIHELKYKLKYKFPHNTNTPPLAESQDEPSTKVKGSHVLEMESQALFLPRQYIGASWSFPSRDEFD